MNKRNFNKFKYNFTELHLESYFDCNDLSLMSYYHETLTDRRSIVTRVSRVTNVQHWYLRLHLLPFHYLFSLSSMI